MYKVLYLEDVSKVEKDCIKALEDMEVKLYGEGHIIEITRSSPNGSLVPYRKLGEGRVLIIK